MPLLSKLVTFARSPQGKKLLGEAQRRAKDPQTRAQVQQLVQRARSGRGGSGQGGSGQGGSGQAGSGQGDGPTER
ncbi:hypothetical protein EV189_1511 [Motilibacter rhizosphaerae]|uniref:Uncharacterized protein n=1 Tax=Motilibacter rhizosphaerae TaxID=598652 RepID=A0A4Q7NSI4_9ACTN|nr:hypothetical protein [Motilibacter rhizosphaerae]RZS89738.1 hypothetical protein EV189_1511 [Motilibacter rhizosphaerae]